jgi:hypothetical protein
MQKQNYIVLIHFAAKLSRQNLAAVAPIVNQAVRDALSNCEAILATDTTAAFVGASESSAMSLFKDMASGLRPGDQLSIIEMAEGLATSHQGLRHWANATIGASRTRPS